MSHTLRIKHLEESYRVLVSKIEAMENGTEPDQDKLATLFEHKDTLYKELVKARKQQYDAADYVEFDDE